MPHLSEALKNNIRLCRKFNNYKPHNTFRQLLPPVLKDRVSGKSDSQKQVACLQEMSTMLNCFKEYDFDQLRCSKEVTAFNKCYAASQVRTKAVGHPVKNPPGSSTAAASAKLQAAEAQGMVPGQKRISSKHVNTLFKRHPQPK